MSFAGLHYRTRTTRTNTTNAHCKNRQSRSDDGRIDGWMEGFILCPLLHHHHHHSLCRQAPLLSRTGRHCRCTHTFHIKALRSSEKVKKKHLRSICQTGRESVGTRTELRLMSPFQFQEEDESHRATSGRRQADGGRRRTPAARPLFEAL